MFWSHKYDFVLKLLSLAICIGLLIPILNSLDSTGSYSGRWYVFGMMAIAVVLFMGSYLLLFRTISTFAYAKFTLKMNLSFHQARTLNNAYTPLLPHNKWLPMQELRDMPDDTKYETALAILQQWEDAKRSERNAKRTEFANAPLALKALKILFGALMVWIFIAGVANLPPCSYITNFIMWAGGDRYYPMLNICLLILPVAVVYKSIDAQIKRRNADD